MHAWLINWPYKWLTVFQRACADVPCCDLDCRTTPPSPASREGRKRGMLHRRCPSPSMQIRPGEAKPELSSPESDIERIKKIVIVLVDIYSVHHVEKENIYCV